MYIGLDSFKTKGGGGAKIVHQVRPCISWRKPVRRASYSKWFIQVINPNNGSIARTFEIFPLPPELPGYCCSLPGSGPVGRMVQRWQGNGPAWVDCLWRPYRPISGVPVLRPVRIVGIFYCSRSRGIQWQLERGALVLIAVWLRRWSMHTMSPHHLLYLDGRRADSLSWCAPAAAGAVWIAWAAFNKSTNNWTCSELSVCLYGGSSGLLGGVDRSSIRGWNTSTAKPIKKRTLFQSSVDAPPIQPHKATANRCTSMSSLPTQRAASAIAYGAVFRARNYSFLRLTAGAGLIHSSIRFLMDTLIHA